MKYAIYQGKIGLYALYYYDKYDPEILKEEFGVEWKYIKPEDLPIVSNGISGKHSFSPNEEGFIKIVEVEDGQEPLTREEMFPKNDANFEYGWISPDGDTYNSGKNGHINCAEAILKELGIETNNAERYLEEHGWAKTLTDGTHKFVYAKDMKITKQQAEIFYDLGLDNDRDVKFMIKCNEKRW